jgi:hypothetical protein
MLQTNRINRNHYPKVFSKGHVCIKYYFLDIGHNQLFLKIFPNFLEEKIRFLENISQILFKHDQFSICMDKICRDH